ncbi:MAG: TAXI family TRAP transporter solute-binding subunit [Alphaproteobacteria bacterium]|nr:TAXI family TRAP transporter solute-binding subunit [Alphaproteobacteria bacterium]
MKSLLGKHLAGALTALAAMTLAADGAKAQDVKLPTTITWSSYTVGSSGYNNTVSIGKVLKDKLGVNLRPIPGKNDIARLAPIRTGKVDFGLAGGGAPFAFEGDLIFARKDWGPQRLRVLVFNNPDSGVVMITRGDSGIKTWADVKGRKVATVLSSAAIEVAITGGLAFGGYGWNDVERVEFPGYVASVKGVMDGDADVAFALSTTSVLYQMESSPSGLHYIPMPKDDKEGWARLQKVAFHIVPHMATEGAGLSKDKPLQTGTYPYPVLAAYADKDADFVYNMTKAMYVFFDDYKDAAPGNAGFGPDRQLFDWVVPFHPGAIKYLKEAGLWKPEYDAHQAKLLAREEVLQAAWAAFLPSAPADDAAFKDGWLTARRAALTKAGM